MALTISIGLDVMRYENVRTVVQNTADRAALSAADLEQYHTAEEVVADYFERAGLGALDVDVTADTGFNARQVSISTGLELPTLLMRLVGFDELRVPAAATAREAISDVEISLVLDYSMSMRTHNKYTTLQSAASDFVDMLFAGPIGPGLTMNYVPYAGTVNIGPAYFDQLGGARVHGQSSCIEVENAHFQNTDLPQGPHAQVPHFERYYDKNNAYNQWGWCPPDYNRVRVASANPAELRNAINTSLMNGGTGTDIAMKYAVAFLDPATRPTLETAAWNLPPVERPLSGRPLAWNDPKGQKYIVLMTDGGITGQFRPRYTRADEDFDDDDEDNEGDNDGKDGIDFVKLNSEVLIHQQRNLIGRSNIQTTRSKNQARTNFFAMCNQAKDNGVMIFTIAFRAPAQAQDEMRTCASTPSMYYDVQDLDISVAFSSIALQISKLRLTN